MQDNSPEITLQGPIADDIQKHLHKSFGELPAALAGRVEQAFEDILISSKRNVLNIEERLTQGAATSCSDIALRWNESTPEQRSRIAVAFDLFVKLQRQHAEREIMMASAAYIADWHDEIMHASSWWNNESITPAHAAMILSGHNPNRGTEECMMKAAETTTSGGVGPDEFLALKNKFEGASKDRPRTLKDWMEYAQQHEQKIHSWIGEWLHASGITFATPPSPRAVPSSAKPWVEKAQNLAKEYISAWRDAKYEPTVEDAALYVEGKFSGNGIYGVRGELLDRATIKKEALTGITGRPRGAKSRLPKVPGSERKNLPKK